MGSLYTPAPAPALKPCINQRQIGDAGREQTNRQGQLHALAGSVIDGSHAPTIRRFDAASPGDSFLPDSPLVKDSGGPRPLTGSARTMARSGETTPAAGHGRTRIISL